MRRRKRNPRHGRTRIGKVETKRNRRKEKTNVGKMRKNIEKIICVELHKNSGWWVNFNPLHETENSDCLDDIFELSNSRQWNSSIQMNEYGKTGCNTQLREKLAKKLRTYNWSKIHMLL